MNTTKGIFSHKSDEWETPQWLFDNLNEGFHFDLDVCATDENTKCAEWYTEEADGLKQDWGVATVWCNPPYSQCEAWCKKVYEHYLNGGVGVMLLPVRTDTRWFHDYVWGKAEIIFIRGRLRFGGSTQNAPFPSMVVVYAEKWGVKPWLKS